MFKTILFTLDLAHADTWGKALPVALEAARAWHAELHVLTVVPEVAVPALMQAGPFDYEAQLVPETKAALEEFVREQVPADVAVRTHDRLRLDLPGDPPGRGADPGGSRGDGRASPAGRRLPDRLERRAGQPPRPMHRDAGALSRPQAGGSDHQDLEVADLVDVAVQAVAALDRADAGGRAGHDQVARLQRRRGRRGRRSSRATFQIIWLRSPVLAGSPLTSSLIAPLAGWPIARGRHERPAGRRMLEGLADLPGAAQLLGLALQVAPGHVEADGVAEDVVQRACAAGCRCRRCQRHHQLDLVVHVAGSPSG